MTNSENFAYEPASSKINPRLSEQSKIFRKQIYQTAECVYTAVGYAIETPVMIVGKDGIIIVDPCESHDAMVVIMEEFRKITSLPVTGVIYTHHHPDHWAGVGACTSEEEVRKGNCVIIAHQDFEYQVARMTGILADIKIGRSMYMYGYLLPVGEEGRVNLGLGPMMQKDTQDYIAPTKTFDSSLNITISGIELELYHIPSECVDELCVWMPSIGVLHVAECIQGENFPNLYSIRGSNRDPLAWIHSIDLMRKFPAEDLVGNHMRPVHGKRECADHLRDYRDMIQYTHDQSIRCINKGLTPDNIIRELKQLPPHLFQRARMGEHYGTFIQAIKLVFSHNIGWFNGDAATLDPLAPAKAARNYVDLIGRTNILEATSKALQEGDARWAAELVSYLVKADHQDMEARVLKAKALRQLGYETENGPFRNWYMTQAMNLEGQFEAVKQAVPEFNGPEVYYAALSKVPPQYLWDCLKVKLNGFAAGQAEVSINITLQDCDISNDLEIRKGILEVHEAHTFHVTGSVTMTKDDYVLLFTKMCSVQELMSQERLISDLTVEEVSTFFAYFDGFTPLFDMEFPFE